MPIPHVGEIREALLGELIKAGETGKRQDIIEKLAQRFRLTAAEREVRDPSGARTFDHAVDSAVANLREAGWMEPLDESGRGVWKLTPAGIEDLVGPTPTKVKSATKATEIALSFLKEHYQFIPQQPIKAAREDNVWLVEIDVGLLRTRIAKIKIDARTADILEYSIPPEEI